MTERYRGFSICGGAAPLPEFLLGRISQWYPTGSIDYVRPARSVVAFTRFQLRSMTFDEQEDAGCFGLEIARPLVDSSYREF